MGEAITMWKQNRLSILGCAIIAFLSLGMNLGSSKSSDNNASSAFIKRLIYSDEKTKVDARKELDALDVNSKSKLIPELIIALKYKKINHPNEVVYRYRAAETLGILGPLAKETAPELIMALENDDSDLVRSRAAIALAKIGLEKEKVVPILIEALNDKTIHMSASEALTELGQKAIPFLIEALKGKNEIIQSGAAISLGKMGPVAKEASPILLQALKSTNNESLRHIFSDALKRIGPADAEELSTLIGDMKNTDNGIRLIAVDAIVVKGKPAVPAMMKLLTDPDRDVRFWAAYILGRNKSAAKKATNALINALKDEDNVVRGNTIWALREIDPSIATSKDISDYELAAIDKIITMEPKDEDILIQTIYRLEELIQTYPSSPKLDQVYFKSGLAKIAMGKLILTLGEKSALVNKYHEQNKDDYVLFLGVMYTGRDFKKLIEKYPNSPLAPEAAYLIASEQTGVGECEGDMSCELNRSIGTFLSYIRDYPTHTKIDSVINNINDTLQSITLDPSKGGLWEIFGISESTELLKKYYDVIKTLPNTDLRGDTLYSLARAFISVGQYELAERIYNDLETHYPKYQNARTRAANILFDYSEKAPSGKTTSSDELSQYTASLAAPSENSRLEALDKISRANISERTLLFSLLLVIGNLSEKDSSSAVRKRALEVIGNLASRTSFFRSAVGNCLLYDQDKQNQYYCADLGVNHPDLKSTEFYTYNRERINSIISQATGKTYPSEEMIAEWQAKAIQRDREVVEEIVKRAGGHGINIFRTEQTIVRRKFRPEIVIPLYAVIMLLCGIYCYRIAQQRNADKRFWMILGIITAPISLLYVFLIRRRNKQ